MLTSIIHDCLRYVNTILLTKKIQDNSPRCQLDEVRKEILGHICECFNSEYTKEIEDEVTGKLVYIEGIQEKSHTLCMQLEQAIDEDILEMYVNSSNNISDIIVMFKKCCLLTSTSIFIDLKENQIEDIDVDDKILKDKIEELINELKELFAKKSRVYTRAVMANILSELPVFFVNMNEVIDYVQTQISSCKNKIEKIACYAILSDIMADDDIKWNYDMD